jgi:hypothetical protein
MADIYRGTATLIVDSVETPVIADLMVETSGWLGVLDADPWADFWAFTRGGSGTLRLPNGREADLVPDRSTVATARVAVMGSGMPPF